MSIKKLILIPLPIQDEHLDNISTQVKNYIKDLECFICERARTSRRFIAAMKLGKEINDLKIEELDKYHPENIIGKLGPLFEQYHHIGLMSEAGCPAIADPGNLVVEWAHQNNIEVIPMSGPSSILMALMASGLNGQNFCFKGYLSPKTERLKSDLLNLEKESRKNGSTQIFIETPYRNMAIVQGALKFLDNNTFFHISAGLGTKNAFIKTATIGDWKKIALPDIHKVPAVFCVLSRR